MGGTEPTWQCHPQRNAFTDAARVTLHLRVLGFRGRDGAFVPDVRVPHAAQQADEQARDVHGVEDHVAEEDHPRGGHDEVLQLPRHRGRERRVGGGAVEYAHVEQEGLRDAEQQEELEAGVVQAGVLPHGVQLVGGEVEVRGHEGQRDEVVVQQQVVLAHAALVLAPLDRGEVRGGGEHADEGPDVPGAVVRHVRHARHDGAHHHHQQRSHGVVGRQRPVQRKVHRHHHDGCAPAEHTEHGDVEIVQRGDA
mmetsp:Transcript_4890/g.12311  ORF Transcript_4890/g.12311 Transcript_4890/m.12311 type:complete len:251 (+) Transcript_4890:346-1098(+)